MCAICGFNWNNQRLITEMSDAMLHRGPDQGGVFCCDEVSLGHRRLSIIDLSENARQPMTNEDQSVHLIFNGEIYNFQELRTQLVQKGHLFVSNSDSEVIIHAYEEYGVDALQKLRGMFAFAIFDQKNGLLFLARDRIGIKPIYYYYKDDKFIFASEIKAILKDRTIQRELNHQALFDYLGFEFTPAPATMFRNIYKLPAGHYLTLKIRENNRPTIKQYWDLSFEPTNLPFREAVEKQRELIDQAVKSHLVSDVPLGVFLSGGLDSSTIVAMMRRHNTGTLKTFTIGYQDKTFSELDFAGQVARHFDTDHQVLMLEDLKAHHVEKALWHLDEPMTDLSTVPLMLLCQQAKEYVTVCLSGEGADESYAGYDRFIASKLDRLFQFMPNGWWREVSGKIAAHLPDQPQKKGFINMLKRFLEGSSLPRTGRHLRWQYFLGEEQTRSLFKDALKDRLNPDPFYLIKNHISNCNASDEINREIYLDMRYMMTDSVLMKVDKMSMASSLEIRVPFLDHPLVEFLAAMPGDWKLKGFRTKYAFRSALDGILPDNIVNRGKQGYSLPVKHLLRNELKGYMCGLLNDSTVIREHFNVNYINQLIEEHSNMTHNHNHILWGLMNIAIWHNRFFN